MDRIRDYLSLRDIPLWFAAAGVFMLAAIGVAASFGRPDILPAVAIVVLTWILVLAAGRFVVRRLRYSRLFRVAVAVLAVLLAFGSGFFGGWYLIPAAVSLLLVELFAPSPGSRVAPAPPSGEPREFDWPDEPADG